MSLDYDKGLVAAILREGKPGLRKVRDRIFDNEILLGEGRAAYEFVTSFYTKYSMLPEMAVLVEQTGTDLDPDPIGKDSNISAPLEWWIDKIVDRRVEGQLRDGVTEALSNLDQVGPQEAVESIEKALHEIRRERLVSSSKIETLGPLGQEVLKYYQDVKGGKKGIQSPWPSINDATFGFWPQDLAIFVSRVGIGKTWTAVLLALQAWKDGHRVLFATTEISRVRIAMRFLAAYYRLSYSDLRFGKLGKFGEMKLEQGVRDVMEDNRFFVAGGDFDFRVEPFSAGIADVDRTMLPLDGAYLLRVDGKSRTERAANAFDELKRLANQYNVPFIVTMQFNRNVKANVASSVGIENIGLTDVAAWNADLCYALIQTDDMRAAKTMSFKPLKVREGVGEEFDVTWDLDTMNFPEQPKDGGGGDADEGFGADLPEHSPEEDKAGEPDMPF